MTPLRLLRFPLTAGRLTRLATFPARPTRRHLFTTTTRRTAQDDDKPLTTPPSELDPAAATFEPAPAASTSESAPATAPSEPAPAASTSEPAPAASTSESAPAASTSESAPATPPSEPAPAASTSESAPATSTSESAPATSTSESAPAASTSEPAPATAPSKPTAECFMSEFAPTTAPSEPTPRVDTRITNDGLTYYVPTRHTNVPTGPSFRYGARVNRTLPPHLAHLRSEYRLTIYPAALTLDRIGTQAMHLSNLWLRDACPCPLCVDPDSGQKTFSTADLPVVLPITSATIDAATGALRVVWGGDVEHTSEYPAASLAEWESDGGFRTPYRLPLLRTLWDRTTYEGFLSKGETKVTYDEWMGSEEGFWRAYEALLRTGLIFVSGVPEGKEDAVEGIAARIGEIQTTFYGKTWDVRSKPRAENVAYTSQFLGLHQDLMYHDPIPRLQLLHCLENGCEGGESIFSDGLRAAYEIREMEDQGPWESLTSPNLHFQYKKGGHDYEVRHEAIHVAGNLIDCTHWSPPFQAPFRRESMELTPEGPKVRLKSGRLGLQQWHQAARLFQQSLDSPANTVEMKLSPGECVIFDNWRVLHGRREFKASEGHRWLKGTYITDQVTRARENELQARDPARFRKADRREELDTHRNRAILANQERLSLRAVPTSRLFRA